MSIHLKNIYIFPSESEILRRGEESTLRRVYSCPVLKLTALLDEVRMGLLRKNVSNIAPVDVSMGQTPSIYSAYPPQKQKTTVGLFFYVFLIPQKGNHLVLTHVW